MEVVGAVAAILSILAFTASGFADFSSLHSSIFDPGHLKPVDSTVKVAIGQVAPWQEQSRKPAITRQFCVHPRSGVLP